MGEIYLFFTLYAAGPVELEQSLAGKAKLLFPVMINGALNLLGGMCFTLDSLPGNRAAGSFYFKLIEETSAHRQQFYPLQ